MTSTEPHQPDELRAIERQRSWIALTSVLAVVVLVVAVFRAPPTAIVVVAAIILIALKKAAVKYHALGKRRADLVRELSPEEDQPAASTFDT